MNQIKSEKLVKIY